MALFLKILNKKRGNADITMWIPSFVIEQQRLTGSWMDLAPILIDNTDMNYRAILIQEHQGRTVAMQQDFNALQQEYQNNPNKPVLFRDEKRNPLAPAWNPPTPYDPTLQSTMDYYNNVFIYQITEASFPWAITC